MQRDLSETVRRRRHATARLRLAAAVAAVALGATAASGVAQAAAPSVDQPALPGWFTLADGSASLTDQSIDGITADEYGSTPTADPTLYSGSSGYPYAPSFAGQNVIGAVLADMNGSDPGDTDAVVLSQTPGAGSMQLSLLGPQSNGYQLVTSVTVPTSSAVGVIALPALNSPAAGAFVPVGQILVVTHAGYYDYQFTPTAGSPGLGTLAAQNGGNPLSDLPILGAGGGGIIGGGGPTTIGIAPSQILDVYQAPPSEDAYGGGGPAASPAQATFAIAYYTGIGLPDLSYHVELISYSSTASGAGVSSGYTPISTYTLPPPTLSNSPVPLEARYAIAGSYVHLATVTAGISGGPPQMQNFDVGPASTAGDAATPTPIWTSSAGTSTTQNCPLPAGGGLPQLAVDAFTTGTSPGLGAGASVCAALTSDPTTPVKFEVARIEQTQQASGGIAANLIGESSDSPAALALPPNVKRIAVSLDFSCDEFLGGFASNPVTDPVDGTTFPAITTANEDSYCNNQLAAGGQGSIFDESHGAEFNPGSSLAVNIASIAEGSGDDTLNLTSVSYPWQSNAGGPELDCFSLNVTVPGATAPGEPSCAQNDAVLSDTTNQLADLGPAASSPQLTLLPIERSDFVQTEQLITDPKGNAIQDPFTRDPVPVALLAAPPYYAGGQQQITSTSMTLDKTQCSSVTNEMSNMVGAEAGEDAEVDDLFDKAFEEELLLEVEASWTSSITHEACNDFSQQFIGGNFGNDFTHDNSLVFSVQTGTITYGNVLGTSLGVGLTPNCTAADLQPCSQIFDPAGISYALQTLPQIENPPPNDFYATDDRILNNQYGDSLRAHLPDVGNPSSYPSDGSSAAGAPPPTGGMNQCTGTPSGAGSGNAGITLANPFVSPTVTPPETDLLAGAASEVDPAVGANEAGTTSTIMFDTTTDQSSSTELSIGASYAITVEGFHAGVSYSHGWGLEDSTSLTNGTEFEGGVNDFQGYFNPYQYQMYECKVALSLTPGSGPPGQSLPAFLAGYMVTETGSSLPLNFAAPSLPSGTVGQTYAGQVFATGGQPAYQYTVTSGSSLPPGLSLDGPTGQLSGTPTLAGTYTFTLAATDTIGTQVQQTETVTINPALADVNPLPSGNVGVPYSQSIGTTGADGTYNFLLSSGQVPPGLTFNNTTGTLAGTPTTTGTYCFTVYVTDTETPPAAANLQSCVTIGDNVAITTASLPSPMVGTPYSTTIAATGGNSAAYAFSDTGTTGGGCTASLPGGLTLNSSTGALTGTPTTAGVFCFTVFVNDGGGGAAQQLYRVSVLALGTGAAPAITSANATTFVTGSNGTFTVKTAGSPTAVISESGGLPPGVSLTDNGNGTATLAGTPSTGSTGSYPITISATNGVSPDAAQSFTLTVNAGPVITLQPTDQSVAVGSPAPFTAAASGTPTPSGTWQVSRDGGGTWTTVSSGFDGDFLATIAPGSLTIFPLDSTADQLQFRDSFTNSVGTTPSDAATLTVDYAPSITKQPADDTINAGDDATFSAAANGEAPPTVQWEVSSDGGTTWTDISGATGPTLTLHGVPASDSADLYRAAFTNAAGAATSSAAMLTVGVAHAATIAPTVTTSPSDQTVVAGAAATFSASAGGTPAPTVQWEVSGDGGTSWTALSGATSPTLALTSVPASDDGNRYAAVFTNTAGTITTNSAKLTVQTAPAVTQQPADQTVVAGAGASFTAAASGSPTPIVQWQASTDGGATWTNVAGATSPTLALTAVPGADDGSSYRAVFTNPAGSATSAAASLSVQLPPTITQQPAGQSVGAGSNVSFSAAATGRPTPTVQWQVSTDGGSTWAALSGASAPTLTLLAVPAGDDGHEYRAAFTNAAGSATSSAATLAVTTAPVVTTAPTSTTAVPGGSITLVSTAGGSPAPSMSWQMSTDGGVTWITVPGATGSTLTLTDITQSQSGTLYRSVATNSAGTTTSPPAMISVAAVASAAALACTEANVTLINVVTQGDRVVITGVARQTLIGRKVLVKLVATHKVVANTTVGADGSFSATAPLPSPAIRASNRGRYVASVGPNRSQALKLSRRLYLTSTAVGGGKVHLAGHVTGGFRVGTKVTITERTSCTTTKVVATARLGKHGTWSATAPAPTGLASTLALFRAQTTVLYHHATVMTYSLPDPVNG